MRLLNHIISIAEHCPDSAMVEVLAHNGEPTVFSYKKIIKSARVLANKLNINKSYVETLKIGLVMKNSPLWVVADIACLLSKAIEVPVPLAFSAEQAWSLLSETDICLVDEAGCRRLMEWINQSPNEMRWPTSMEISWNEFECSNEIEKPTVSPTQPDDICKLIHTSGTTSHPKGVKIRVRGLDLLIPALLRRVRPGTYQRYLSMAPLSLLIEQVTAIYMTFSDGGCVVFLPDDEPLLGESSSSVNRMLQWIKTAGPTAITITPALVQVFAERISTQPEMEPQQLHIDLFGKTKPPLIACGGAPVARDLIKLLAAHDVFVYEGYGLSETSSVVSWNSAEQFRIGTAGKPLEHMQVKTAHDGELLVRGEGLFAGYTRTDPSSCNIDDDGWLHTGDLGSIDNEGYIRIYGRKKNLIITANGRNISPEWVEAKYKTLNFIDSVVLFGNGLEHLHGFFSIKAGVTISEAENEIRTFGERYLSEIERADRIVTVTSSPEIYKHYYTLTGRPRREIIWKHMLSELNTEVFL